MGRGECTETEVMRAFMEHPEWLAPAWCFGKRAPGRKVCFDGQHVVPEGEMWVFTESATANHASQSGTRLGTYVGGLPGTELFGVLMPRAKALRINPGGYPEDELYVGEEQYAMFREWAVGVAIERALPWVKGVIGGELLDKMLQHERYHLPFFDDGRMISKPGHGGFEQPGVVCVTPDAFAAFEAAVGPELGGKMRLEVVDAEKLAYHLKKQKIDGVYINPMGPKSCVLSAETFSSLQNAPQRVAESG